MCGRWISSVRPSALERSQCLADQGRRGRRPVSRIRVLVGYRARLSGSRQS
ncbi:hypothetical protein ACFPM0_21935 [Pseudonocardia sulfidoxydans]|uniref:hypothetical protein n=1 Tax=Pseudonocardia sulfidoxydans TaxID=54011 RepID=UPI0036131B2E